jgi:hypothetical protein
VEPAFVGIAVESHAAPHVIRFENDGGVAQHQLGDLLRAEARLRQQRRDGGESDDGAQLGACPAFAAQASQRLTPRKVQMRQMKVPQSTQG